MDWWLVTFFMGAIFSLFLPIVPAFFYVFLFLICFILAYSNQYSRNYSGFFLGCAWIIFIASSYQNIWHTNQIDEKFPANRIVEAIGKIDSIPDCKEKRCRFNFVSYQLNNRLLAHPLNIRLSWDVTTSIPKQGQSWLLFIKIKPAHGLANKGGFSYQTWLRRHYLHATGYVRNKEANQLLSDTVNYRQQAFLNFNAIMPKHYLMPIIQALTFGERSGLDKSHWQILQTTQIQHLIAISGLHIGIVFGFSYFFISLIIRSIPFPQLLSSCRLTRHFYLHHEDLFLNGNSRLFTLTFSAYCAGYYAYLAGFSVPTLRALVMIYWFLFLRLLAIKVSVQTWVSLSIVAIILFMPMSLISMSFWLSAYAVCCIFIIVWRFKNTFFTQASASDHLWLNIKIKSKQLLLLQTSLTLLMLPLATLLSGQFSFVALLANLIAVPLVSFIILPLAIVGLLTYSFFPFLAQVIINP
ncbi:ComEC/Rec2 family competence protein [Thalassotalea piscium]